MKKNLLKGIKVIFIAVIVAAGCFGFGYIGAKYALDNHKEENVIPNVPIVQTSTGDNNTIAQIAANVKNSVVEITTESVNYSNWMQNYISKGAGSGVIVSSDGYIITNYHVIEGSRKISVTTTNSKTYDALVIGYDANNDLALLKIEAKNLLAAKFGDSKKLVVGESAIAIGNPLGKLGGSVTSGIISALDRKITVDGKTMNLLQTSAAINPGNSGGGLFNMNGELIGIVNAKSAGSDIEGLGFAIPSNKVKDVYEKIKNNPNTNIEENKPLLGVTIIDATDPEVAEFYGYEKTGLYIETVKENSNAEKAGLKQEDRIITIDGERITSSIQLRQILASYSKGDSFVIMIERNDKAKELTVRMN